MKNIEQTRVSFDSTPEMMADPPDYSELSGYVRGFGNVLKAGKDPRNVIFCNIALHPDKIAGLQDIYDFHNNVTRYS